MRSVLTAQTARFPLILHLHIYLCFLTHKMSSTVWKFDIYDASVHVAASVFHRQSTHWNFRVPFWNLPATDSWLFILFNFSASCGFHLLCDVFVLLLNASYCHSRRTTTVCALEESGCAIEIIERRAFWSDRFALSLMQQSFVPLRSLITVLQMLLLMIPSQLWITELFWMTSMG